MDEHSAVCRSICKFHHIYNDRLRTLTHYHNYVKDCCTLAAELQAEGFPLLSSLVATFLQRCRVGLEEAFTIGCTRATERLYDTEERVYNRIMEYYKFQMRCAACQSNW